MKNTKNKKVSIEDYTLGQMDFCSSVLNIIKQNIELAEEFGNKPFIEAFALIMDDITDLMKEEGLIIPEKEESQINSYEI